jgi:hypothetical protein
MRCGGRSTHRACTRRHLCPTFRIREATHGACAQTTTALKFGGRAPIPTYGKSEDQKIRGFIKIFASRCPSSLVVSAFPFEGPVESPGRKNRTEKTQCANLSPPP